MRATGVTARGVVSPIFRQGDDLVTSVCGCLLAAAQAEGFAIEDGDIVGITESVVARTQGNYASCAQIAADVRAKFGGGHVGLISPILSRNRFAVLLKGIAMGCEKLTVQLSYPADEVGNALMPAETLQEKGINPWATSFDEVGFRAAFGAQSIHPFTGVDYIDYYKSLGDNIEVVFSNAPAHILNYSKKVLCCDIHTRARSQKAVLAAGGEVVLTLADILSESVDGSGYNAAYGLLGSNMATESSIKLFPRDCQALVQAIQEALRAKTGKSVEVLVYGDGCFKDPVGGIWELADPVVAPAYTAGLAGTPSELKIKYFADNELKDLNGEALAEAVRRHVAEKEKEPVSGMAAQGTTPRRYTDLVGSLCDLVSGSGDRGTPVVYIKGYFSNYASL